MLQLGLVTSTGDIEWIEPVEVWGNFRAARKAQPRNRQSGVLSNGLCLPLVAMMVSIALVQVTCAA